MIFYKNKTLRYNDYNYSNNGFYFITICIKDRRHVFGEIENGKMIINNIGIIAKNIWQNLNKNRKNILLHTFVIMPNHIHGIVQVNNIIPENTSERKNQIIPNLSQAGYECTTTGGAQYCCPSRGEHIDFYSDTAWNILNLIIT